jgi:5-methylcytosine-specific restriction protein A
MPALIPRACRKRGCPAQPPTAQATARSIAMKAGNSISRARVRHERGYGSQWDIRRARILKRDNHLCQNCLRSGRAVAAKTVDHIKAKAHGGTDDDSNLESLCWPCHRTKTGRERSNDIDSHLQGQRGGVKSLTAKAKGPPPNLFSHRRRLENFFGVPHPMINRSFRLCQDHRKPRHIWL